ncbi:uncharacterized protein LOC111718268 [Eurytemora carolleeae]|uniref:uncharacterized protein LOC111718268 n=1 Tax=Eurytemora carolleeae TaxID=1294199 RepID=UPI000C78B4F4|nr:uncharacterized protein LOC111718268 [Eurytemora carolleeae]|eukprot:XP_023349578.1 uncharacterized protein LOC111718268 [Eurytemora affinis]
MKESEFKELDLKNPKSLKTLADYARDETARKLILSSNILSTADWSTNPCSNSLVELCRLFGNLCFNSPAGRQLVDQTNLLSTIFNAVEQQNLKMTESRLFAVVPGLLQNYCIDNPSKNISSIQPLLDQLATQLLLVQDLEMIKPFQDFLFAVLGKYINRNITN